MKYILLILLCLTLNSEVKFTPSIGMDLYKKQTNKTKPKPHTKMDLKYTSINNLHTLSIAGRFGLLRKSISASAKMDYARKFEKHFILHLKSSVKRSDSDGLRYLFIGSLPAEVPLPCSGVVKSCSIQLEPSTIYYKYNDDIMRTSFLGTVRTKLNISYERITLSLNGYYSILATREYRYLAGGSVGLYIRLEDFIYLSLNNSFSYTDMGRTHIRNRLFFGTLLRFRKKSR